jgi:hypothetical protein
VSEDRRDGEGVVFQEIFLLSNTTVHISLSVHASHSFLSFFFLFRINKVESGNNVTLKPCLPNEALFFSLFLFFLTLRKSLQDGEGGAIHLNCGRGSLRRYHAPSPDIVLLRISIAAHSHSRGMLLCVLLLSWSTGF